MSDILNSLLDANLDDLADLPEFQVFPAGAHKVVISFESKEVNKHPCIEAKFKLLETLETSDPTAAPMAVGTEGSCLYMMDNEFGMGNFKKTIKPFAAHLGVSSIRDAIEGANGMEVVIVTKVRQNKEKTQSYCEIVKVLIE